MSRVTIEEVAEQAGVSVATVSRALRGLPNVSPGTRQRVMEVAHDLQYRPDPNASRLAAGKTGTVALGVTAIPIWYTGQVIAGVEAVLTAESYDLTLFLIADPEARHRTLGHPSSMHKRVDGLILVDLLPDQAERDGLGNEHLPWVMVGAECEEVDSVVVDNVRGAALATRHLLALGHQRIGLISGGPASFEAPSPEERRRGFLQALDEAEIEFDPRYERSGNFSPLGGYEAMQELADLDPAPTAIFAMSDEMAIGAMRALWERGLRIPEDVSLVGFDDHDLAFATGLTTVRQDAVELGARGARRLLRRIAGDSTPPLSVVLEPSLIERDSTASPSPADGRPIVPLLAASPPEAEAQPNPAGREKVL